MKLAELHRELVQAELSQRVYILCGEELGVRDLYLGKMRDAAQAISVTCDTVLDAFTLVRKGQLKPQPIAYTVYMDEDFIKEEKKWTLVFNTMNASNAYLFLVYVKLDKRSKFYKQNRANVVEFEALSEHILVERVMQELPEIRQGDAVSLVRNNNNNLATILLECDKLKALHSFRMATTTPCTFKGTLEYAKDENVLQTKVGDITFPFLEAILSKHRKDVAKYMNMPEVKDVVPLALLSLLYSNYRQILLVQAYKGNERDMQERTGLNGWEINRAKQHVGVHTTNNLAKKILDVQRIEEDFKRGRLEEAMLLPYTVVSMLN